MIDTSLKHDDMATATGASNGPRAHTAAALQSMHDSVDALREEQAGLERFICSLLIDLDALRVRLEHDQQLRENNLQQQAGSNANLAAIGEQFQRDLAEQLEAQRKRLEEAAEAQLAAERLRLQAQFDAQLAEAQAQWQREAAADRAKWETEKRELQASQRAELEQSLREEFDKQLAELQEEREMLEAELESVRQRAVDLSQALAGQNQQMIEERSEWTTELRQIRRLLDRHGVAVARPAPPPAAEVPPPTHQPEPPSDPRPVAPPRQPQPVDPVLGSVLSQFEVLQKDLARRRAHQKTTKRTDTNPDRN